MSRPFSLRLRRQHAFVPWITCSGVAAQTLSWISPFKPGERVFRLGLICRASGIPASAIGLAPLDVPEGRLRRCRLTRASSGLVRRLRLLTRR
jgi:hypothetical protein